MPQLDFHIAGRTRPASIDTLIIAGWTRRDKAAVEHHIAELAALGVKRPRTMPCFYRLGANLLTSAAAIEVAGSDSSGEMCGCAPSLTQPTTRTIGLLGVSEGNGWTVCVMSAAFRQATLKGCLHGVAKVPS